MTKANLKNILTAVRDIINRSSEIGIRKAQVAEKRADNAQITADNARTTANSARTTANSAQAAANSAQTAANSAQAVSNSAQTAVNSVQAAADINKEALDCAFSSVATFTFDKQTSGRDTFDFNGFNFYKVSGFNPSPSKVISFNGTRESGEELSFIKTGNNSVQYGLFIVVSSAGVCSIPVTETVTKSFTAPSAGLYAQYSDSAFATAGTGEFTLRESTGSFSITGLLLKSSTADSTKKFKITVDDSGALSATEVTA